VNYTRQGYQNTVSEARPDGLQPPIVCCIEFRLIESFLWHRHTDNAASSNAVSIVLEGHERAKCGSRDAASGVCGAAGRYSPGSILKPPPARRWPSPAPMVRAKPRCCA